MSFERRIGLSVVGGLTLLAVLSGCATDGGTASAASTPPASTSATTSLADQGSSADAGAGPSGDSGSGGGDTGSDPWGGFPHNSLLGNEMHRAYIAFHALPAKQQLSLCTAAMNGGTAEGEAWLSTHHVNRQGMDTSQWNLFLGKQCIPYLGAIFDH